MVAGNTALLVGYHLERTKPGLCRKPAWVFMGVIPTLGKWKQKDPQLKVTVSFLDPVSKTK